MSNAFDAFGIDVSTFEPQKDFSQTSELAPPGKYSVTVQNAELSHSKAGNPLLKMTFDITEGECEGKRIWFVQTMSNSIGLKIVNSFMKAFDTSIKDLQDLDYLIGREAVANVVIEESNGYEPKNRIKTLYKKKVEATQPEVKKGAF